MLKKKIRQIFQNLGYDIRKLTPPAGISAQQLPDYHLYRPLFSPWLGKGAFGRYYELAAPRTLVTPDRCYVLYTLALQALQTKGDFLECGVYKGGTAALLAAVLSDARSDKCLFLFDTFEGMPETDPERDLHRKGNFSDTSLEAVQAYIQGGEHCIFRKGLIPTTFLGLETMRIAFAHVDVDIYKSIIDCLEFIWPRLSIGGFLIFDDYGFPSCPGARTAVDNFFIGKSSIPLCLPTGQAVIFRGTEAGSTT